jgi:hypothetical protein
MCKEDGVSMGLAASRRVESSVGLMGRIGNLPFVGLIRVYRVVLSPVIGGQCRFEPTCSLYALEAYRLYGPIVGTRMTVGRICRCHPWNKGGFDPVKIPDGAGIVREDGVQDEHRLALRASQEGEGDGETPGREEA